MNDMPQSNLVSIYENIRPTYLLFTQRLGDLLKSLMTAHNLNVHIIETRTKSIESFREKIARSGKNYAYPLDEIDDFCGCRIITYYADDVKTVSDIIIREFFPLNRELLHQQEILDVDRFGYLSAHHVIKLNNNRSDLLEWIAFKDLRAEIQVRTVIQHAWSAVSHALQYKQEIAIPSALQRRLFRIAGLFELADEEFVGIRKQKRSLQKITELAVSSGSIELPLTFSTIEEAVSRWPSLAASRSAAISAGFTLRNSITFDDGVSSNAISDIHDLAVIIGVKTINELLEKVSLPDPEYFSRLKEYSGPAPKWKLSDDFLFFFALVDRFSNKISLDFLTDHDWADEYAEWIYSAASCRPI